MNANPRSPKDSASDPPVEKAEAQETLASSFASMYHRQVERAAGLQKNALDVFIQQTADMHNAFRQALRATPLATFIDFEQDALERWARAQKTLLDMTVQQSAAVVGFAKEQTAGTTKTADGLKELVQDTADRTVAVHRVVLDLTAQQTAAAVETIKRQPGVAETPFAAAAESIAKGMDTIIETQKGIVEAAAKPLKQAAGKV